MDWDKFRELYSKPDAGWWDDHYSGTWKVLDENVPVGESQLHPSNQLPQFTKVDQGSDYSYEQGGGEVWMIVSYGTPDGTEAYYKITGWENSYGNVSWNDTPTRVSKKTRTEVFYE